MSFTEPSTNAASPIRLADESAVQQVDREWHQALLNKDAGALDHILPDGFTFINAFGEVLNKHEFLAVIGSTDLMFQAIQREEVSLHFHGNTALARGRDLIEGQYKGHDISGQYRFTNVYVETGGRWHVVSSQATRIDRV
ncbi:MAG: nuclear transport factor 2 family protein [Pyrinomonadaceae bacterium]